MHRFLGQDGMEWSYDEKKRIGDRGGFGVVYGGHDSQGHPVAVKRVMLRWGSEAERRRRDREIEIGKVLSASAANHILQSIDVALEGDDLLIVMPLAERSLASAIQSRDLDSDASYDALLDTTRGLIELAGASVIHRDLKPANILRIDQRWKLADFGIARNLAESTGTFTFLGTGTMPYMAPEIWEGQPASVRSDLYSLGIVAYELLEGVRPFNGTDEISLRNQHLYGVPPTPTNVSPAVGRLLVRLLAKKPWERPQDARTVLETLEQGRSKLTRGQEALRAAALALETASMEAKVGEAHKNAMADDLAKHREEAKAELFHQLSLAGDLIKQALPDAEFEVYGPRWQLSWHDTSLSSIVWPRTGLLEDQGITLAGEFVKSYSYGPLANLICRVGTGTAEFHILRFASESIDLRSAEHPNLPYVERSTHGLRQGEFIEWRRSGSSSRQPKTEDPLSAEAIIQMLLDQMQSPNNIPAIQTN